MGVQRLSHIGICVSDLDRSLAFYRDVLGFRERSSLTVSGADSEVLLDLEDVKLRAVYLERDGTRLELLCFDAPGHTGETGPQPVNRLGLTHLSLRVSDLAATALAAERGGGSVLAGSRIASERYGTRAIFITDPDGLRIELLEAPGSPDALPGERASSEAVSSATQPPRSR